MRKWWIFAAAAFALPASASQPADTVEPLPAEKSAEPAQDADPMVCRTESVTGSRLSRTKTCLKKSQWEARAENARRSLNNRGNSQDTGGLWNPMNKN